jgi:hypothetical protein
VRTRSVGAPISAASLKHLNGQDSSGERPHPSSTQNAAVRSSAGHRARDGSGQGSSFIYMPRQQRKGTHNSVSEIDARTGEREEQCKYRERRCPSALPKPRRRAAWEGATALCAPPARPRPARAPAALPPLPPPSRRGLHEFAWRLFLARRWCGGEGKGGREVLREVRVLCLSF